MGEMEEEETGATRIQLYHKEEAKARIQADAKDKAGLRRKLDYCIDPMDSKEHPEGSTVNIVSGKLAPASVNVENAVMIGETMLEDYEKTWPEGFNSTISKNVETMAASCKFVKIGDSKVYDLNALYSRVIALLSSDRDVDVNDIFSYELAPVQLQCSWRMEGGFVKLSQSSRGRSRLKFRGGKLVMQMPLS